MKSNYTMHRHHHKAINKNHQKNNINQVNNVQTTIPLTKDDVSSYAIYGTDNNNNNDDDDDSVNHQYDNSMVIKDQKKHAFIDSNKNMEEEEDDDVDMMTVTTASITTTSKSLSSSSQYFYTNTYNESTNATTTTTPTKTTTRKTWMNITTNQIPILPNYYIYDHDSVITCSIKYYKSVINDILNLLRTLSIIVKYNDNGNTAICQDIDGIQFHILLWKTTSNNHQNDSVSTTNRTLSSSSLATTNIQYNDDYDESNSLLLLLLIEIRHTGGNTILFYKNQYTDLILQSIQQCIDNNENNNNNNYNNNNTIKTIDYTPKTTTNICDPFTAANNSCSAIQTNVHIYNHHPYNAYNYNNTRDSLYLVDYKKENNNNDEMEVLYQSLQRRCWRKDDIGTDNIHHNTIDDIYYDVLLQRIELIMSNGSMESVYDSFVSLLYMTNPNRCGYRVAKTIATQILSESNATTITIRNMILSLAFLQSWWSSTDRDIEKKTDSNNSIIDIRYDATTSNDHILIALRLIGQAINLIDTNTIQQFVVCTNTILQQHYQRQSQNSSNDISSVSIQDVLLEYIKNNENDEPFVVYCATHILARLCETISYICSYVLDTIIMNSDNYSNVFSIAARNTTDVRHNEQHVFGSISSNSSAMECATLRLINAIDIKSETLM